MLILVVAVAVVTMDVAVTTVFVSIAKHHDCTFDGNTNSSVLCSEPLVEA